VQAVVVSPTALSFGEVAAGSISAARNVTVSNGQPAAISLSVNLGGSNPSQFRIITSASTCGSSLAANSSCTVAVAFKPKSSRSYNAMLKINAKSDSGSPHLVAVSGTGA
jgi:hypothetical protein